MHVILTHEQADFDALASLLGFHLNNESAIPVLPRKMNRNVGAFVTLYGADLPFVDARDLPNEPIETISLVDTQSFVTLKGTSGATKVNIVDHHPLRDDLPPEWQITIDPTGATVTIFVEAIREQDIRLNVIQATLLLLGIYEDTGSLTYTRTTPRDLNAAAFLLERGASLQIAADFLNHPLSKQQQKLYDHLRSSAETHDVYGYSVVIAIGDALGVDEELSTIAHKLKDLLDPDALILLIKTRGGVQFIARSTNDNIDVSKIAEHFGGGGHTRAAAALVREDDVRGVRDELVKLLPAHVRPAITVSQIMSRGPQVLTPATSAKEAARRMQRYGYEGYPVVEDGKVVGLLTRRAVDRALSHDLNLTAASLMEAGGVSVRPGDSLEYLQRRMTDTGWGQIPVVHPETGKIIGIVTRTDLLKTLTQDAAIPGRQNLAPRLESALPEGRLALLRLIAETAYEQRSALYIVGGFVRDLLLERPSLDFDLVVEGDAIQLAKTLVKKYGGRLTSHARFGTAKWLLYQEPKNEPGGDHETKDRTPSPLDYPDLPESIDLITARTEFYTHPTALPTVEQGSIKLDLHRRDFTINTLALRLDGRHYGELHDYWGGLNDLRQGLVRCLHSLSFVDDPTRMLRAVRFEQRFEFVIEERTLELLVEALPLIDRVSGDRIRHELNHILDEDRFVEMLTRLDELSLLSSIHPRLMWDSWLKGRFKRLVLEEKDRTWETWGLGVRKNGNRLVHNGIPVRRQLAYAIWLIRLSKQDVNAVLARLKFPSSLADDLSSAGEVWRILPELESGSPSQVVTRLADMPLVAVAAAYAATDVSKQLTLLEDYALRWRHIQPTIDGYLLRSKGLPPGPVYRHILELLRNAWLDGMIHSADQEKELVDILIADWRKDQKDQEGKDHGT